MWLRVRADKSRLTVWWCSWWRVRCWVLNSKQASKENNEITVVYFCDCVYSCTHSVGARLTKMMFYRMQSMSNDEWVNRMLFRFWCVSSYLAPFNATTTTATTTMKTTTMTQRRNKSITFYFWFVFVASSLRDWLRRIWNIQPNIRYIDKLRSSAILRNLNLAFKFVTLV